MLFISSIPVLIRHLWQLKTVVFLHWCLIHSVLLDKELINRVWVWRVGGVGCVGDPYMMYMTIYRIIFWTADV